MNCRVVQDRRRTKVRHIESAQKGLQSEYWQEFSGTFRAPSAVEQSAPATIYDAVLPVIVGALDKPVSADDLAKRLDVAKGQLQKWLKRAVTDKKIKKLNKPLRYQRKN